MPINTLLLPHILFVFLKMEILPFNYSKKATFYLLDDGFLNN